MALNLTVPGVLIAPDQFPVDPISLSGHGPKLDIAIIGIFGPATSEKEKFFRTVCEDFPETSTGYVPIRRGIATVNDVKVYIIDFPNLYEGECMKDSDTLLQTVQCLERYTEGRLRGMLYIHGTTCTDEEYRSFQLFKALLGEETLRNSTLALQSSAAHRFLLQNDLFHDIPIPSVSLVDSSAETYSSILDELVRRPAFTTLYQQEAAQKQPLSKTTVGRLLDSYLADDEIRISSARALLQGKGREPQDLPASFVTSPRTHQRTKSDINRELEAAKYQIIQLEADCAAAQSQLAAQDESLLALEDSNQRLQLKNEELEQVVQHLHSKDEGRILSNTKGVCVQTDFSAASLLSPLPAPDDLVTLRLTIESLQSDLVIAGDEKATSANEVNRLSAELAAAMDKITQLKSTNAELGKKVEELEKKANGLEKKNEGIQTKHDVLDKKFKELGKENEALVKEKKAASGVQTQLKSAEDKVKSTEDELKRSKQELETLRKKQDGLEKERQQAIKISEEILKSNENLKKELEAAKGQADNVQKQAKGKIADLQKTIDGKDARLEEQRAQLKDIASAAGAWAAASAEVESLKGHMQAERAQADTRYEVSQTHISELQDTLRTEREAWEAERDWGTSELRRLELVNSALGMELKMETMLREAEIEGYSRRISELEEWGQSRWDAVGSNCIIA